MYTVQSVINLFQYCFFTIQKTGFMVCSLIGATHVVPTMFGLGVLGSITVSNVFDQ